MKKCPFCAEEIQSEAIKCRYCGERFDEKPISGVSDEQLKNHEKLRGQDDGPRKASKAEPPPVLLPQQSTVPTAPIEKKKQLPEEGEDRLITLPNKPYSMNQVQKRILIGIIAVLMAMIMYPPFHLAGKNGVVYNVGYSWIFSPPQSGLANVNVAMLLVQWIGVLIVGGVAFFLIKGTSVNLLSSPKKSTVATPPKEKPKEEVEDLYKAMLGEKNCAYYLKKFELFDQKASGLKASWNWAAFFGGGIWVLYRKMYGWFFAFWGFGTILAVILRILKEAGSSGLPAIVFIAFWVTFTIYADSLYHRNIKKKIAIAQLTLRDEPKLLEFLHHKGGVHTWVLWVFALMPVTGILAAIAIPNFVAYKERSQNTVAVSKPAEPVEAAKPDDIDRIIKEIYKDQSVDAKLQGRATIKTVGGREQKYVPVDYDPFADEIGRDGHFIAYNNGTVLDTKTNLMWAAKDNGKDITWANAKSYCKNYRGGGYKNWRMPTQDELAGLYDKAKTYKSKCGDDVHLTELIRLTCIWIWASETRGSDSAVFAFVNGWQAWTYQSDFDSGRALPVRSGK